MPLIDYLRKPRNKRERKVASHARRRERERIIGLLNEMLADNWDWAEDCDCDGCIRINKMFALIKGKN